MTDNKILSPNGSIMKLHPALCSTSFHAEFDGGLDMQWDGHSKIVTGDAVLYLGETTHQHVPLVTMARIFHPRLSKIGYVRLDHITEVK